MRLTEAEARQKICLQSMTGDFDKSPKLCIASQCMAWRWCGRDTLSGGTYVDKSYGFCGLAVFPLLMSEQQR